MGAGLGGAVFVRRKGQFTASQCQFNDNQAIGGKVYYLRTFHFSSKTWHEVYPVPQSYGQGKGGVLFGMDNSRIFLWDCSFKRNSADNSEGVFTPGVESQDNNDLYGSILLDIDHPMVKSILLDVNSRMSETEIAFFVTFDRDVTGVDVTDFDFYTDDRNDTRISSVETIDAQTYRVVLKKSRDMGYVALKLVDDDSIRDITGTHPLGKVGIGNGNYIGERYDFYMTWYANSILPLTGAFEDYGFKVKNGIELSVSDINKSSYTNGFVINSTLIDNQSTNESIQDIINGEKDKHEVLALVGGAVSTTTLKMAELCGQYQFPLFSPTATSSLLSDMDYTAKVIPLDNYQIDALYKVLIDNVGGEVFIIAEDTEYGSGFLNLAEKDGIVSKGKYTFSSNALDVNDATQAITLAFETSNPTIVIASYEDEANQMLLALAQSENARLRNATIILTDAGTTPKSIEGLPEFNKIKYNPTILGLTPIIPDTQSAQNFASEYQNNYGSAPEWVSYYGYDAVVAFSESIKKATEITRQGIWSAIPGLRFEGITGTKTFDEKGNLYSAAYDLHYVNNGTWTKAETILVFQPNDDPAQTSAKTISRSHRPSNVSTNFTYSLSALDPLISHLAGEQAHGTGWIVEPLDAPMGGVLMAYYEDIERGLSVDNQPFVFQDGQTYYLTFNVLRESVTTEPPTEGDILDITVKSVYRYQNGDGVTHFTRQDLMNHKVTFTDWPNEGSTQITIPITYQSASPDGVVINDEDNRFHWELKLLNAAQQKVLLTTVEIGTSIPTAVEDFMLY